MFDVPVEVAQHMPHPQFTWLHRKFYTLLGCLHLEGLKGMKKCLII